MTASAERRIDQGLTGTWLQPLDDFLGKHRYVLARTRCHRTDGESNYRIPGDKTSAVGAMLA